MAGEQTGVRRSARVAAALPPFGASHQSDTRGGGRSARGKSEADGSCTNVTGHAVTSKLGEEIVAAG